MLYRTRGNLLNIARALNLDFAHGCNCYCKFGTGLALEIKKTLPDLYRADMRTVRGDPNKLGGFTYHTFGWGTGFNIYSQFRYSWTHCVVNYDALYNGLLSVMEFRYEKVKPLAIPWIGGGAAGGDINTLLDIFNAVSESHNLLLVDFTKSIEGDFTVLPGTLSTFC